MVFALAGNQNCGKTTLFNQLTGSNQHVGNFPGVTVDKKEGVIRGHNTCEHRHGPRSWGHPKTPAPAVCEMATVVDLPGIYSLSPYTSEEIVTRDFLIKEKPDGIINIVDATNIERNLYLSMQLIELNLPMVIALNMMDEMRANGNTVDVNKLEEELGVPVVPISAAKNEGIDELIEHAQAAGFLFGRGAPLHPFAGAHRGGPRRGRRRAHALCRHKTGGGRQAHDGHAAPFGK